MGLIIAAQPFNPRCTFAIAAEKLPSEGRQFRRRLEATTGSLTTGRVPITARDHPAWGRVLQPVLALRP